MYYPCELLLVTTCGEGGPHNYVSIHQIIKAGAPVLTWSWAANTSWITVCAGDSSRVVRTGIQTCFCAGTSTSNIAPQNWCCGRSKCVIQCNTYSRQVMSFFVEWGRGMKISFDQWHFPFCRAKWSGSYTLQHPLYSNPTHYDVL